MFQYKSFWEDITFIYKNQYYYNKNALITVEFLIKSNKKWIKSVETELLILIFDYDIWLIVDY
jgi:hypothetical protein